MPNRRHSISKHIPNLNQLPLLEPITITLTRGYEATIDIIDADLSIYKWCVSDKTYPYPQRRIAKGKLVFLHRIILERSIGRALIQGEMPDHVDDNPLNCQRSNLRLATKTSNAQNAKRRSDNVSGYKGVARTSPHYAKRWRAVIKVNKKQIVLGYFDDPKEAYAAYCEAAKYYFGEFARLE